MAGRKIRGRLVKGNTVTEPHLKMYVLVKETTPIGLAVNSVGHAVLACYRRFEQHPDTTEWINSTLFRKVTCTVSDREFEHAKQFEDYVVITEAALEGREVSIAFRPRRVWPTTFRFYKLFGKNGS